MVKTMTYEELEKVCEKNWTTDGPNSGGVSGYFLYQGFLYCWDVEWGCDPYTGSPLTISQFREYNADTTNPRIKEILTYLGNSE